MKDTSLILPYGEKGNIIDIKIYKQKTINIIIYIVSKKKIKLGDKISGRHGNKGIISRIEKNENMPYLQDGTIVDIELNYSY